MSTQTLAQRRAAHALASVERHVGKSHGNYVSYVSALPATILMNGLGQACATLLSKAGADQTDPHRLLYVDLEQWLCGADSAAPYKGTSRLMNAIVSGSPDNYLRAQAEALSYLVWLKKFANAYLDLGKPE